MVQVKRKQSSLRNEERIHLAFNSLLEIIVFAFCTLFMFQGDYQNTQDYHNVIQLLLNSINVLIGNIVDDNFTIKCVFLVIEAITCTSLIGLVITTYITSDENYVNMGSAPSPYLFVVSNSHISIFTMQLQKNGCYSLIVTEENFANHSFQIFNTNNRIVINNKLIKNNRNGSYIFKHNGIYEITYCEHLNRYKDFLE